MNALLSMGTLKGDTVICPLHCSKFNIMTGKLVSSPVLSMEGLEVLPIEINGQTSGELMGPIKTHDLTTFEVKMEGDKILVKI